MLSGVSERETRQDASERDRRGVAASFAELVRAEAS